MNREFESHLWRGVLGTKLWDKVCQRLVAGPWFFLVAPMLSTNETERHDITGILLTIALSTIILTLNKCVVGEKIIKTNNVKNVFLNTKDLEINRSARYSNCHFCRHWYHHYFYHFCPDSHVVLSCICFWRLFSL